MYFFYFDESGTRDPEVTGKRKDGTTFAKDPFYVLVAVGLYPNAFRIFRARSVSYGTTERPMALQSQRDCVLQPRVAESARLPWEDGSLAVNPNGVAASGEARWSQPLWGRGLRTIFTQGSSRLATLGFGAESLWDSSLEFPKGIGLYPYFAQLVPAIYSSAQTAPDKLDGLKIFPDDSDLVPFALEGCRAFLKPQEAKRPADGGGP